jgi:regulator of sigma E protease
MDSLSTFAWWIWQYGIVFLFVLTVVVFIHELGHFLVARWCGVTVKAFSIGFGPEIYGFYDRYGTRWRFAWIPLGGYVKFVDDENPSSFGGSEKGLTPTERAGAFQSKSVGARAAVVAAGPLANFILATVIYAGLNATVGLHILPPYVDAVVANSPAEKGGFKAGDMITAINGDKIERFDDLQRIVGSSAGEELSFTVDRGGQSLVLKATPNVDEQRDAMGRTFRRGLIGIQRAVAPDKVKTVHVGIPQAIMLGIGETYTNLAATVGGLRDIITRKQSAEQMGGPIMMAEVTAKVAELGIEPMLRWIAFISANIGFLNLLPIPVLDGGHLMFYAFEAVRRKPASEKLQQMGFQVGLALLMLLMVFVNFNDIMNVWRRLTGSG